MLVCGNCLATKFEPVSVFSTDYGSCEVCGIPAMCKDIRKDLLTRKEVVIPPMTKPTQKDKFPRTLYVETPLNPGEAWQGYDSYDDLPEDTITAVYHLVEVRRVTETKITTLEPAPESTYEIVDDEILAP